MARALMRIACLHTAESNIAVYEAAAGEGVQLQHMVRADLLAAAEAAGAVPPEVARETAALLAGLATTADAVLLTCSTLGPIADDMAPGSAPLLRADRALAEQAVAAGGPIVVLCAAETTLAPTEALFRSVAEQKAPARSIEVRLVRGAWKLFRAGEMEAYLDTIAAAADAAYTGGAAIVALAQSSMAEAAGRCAKGCPLTSPAAALARISAGKKESHP